MLDLEVYLIDDPDEEPEDSIKVMEDETTITDPRVRENKEKAARRRSYMRNRQKYANAKRIAEMKQDPAKTE